MLLIYGEPPPGLVPLLRFIFVGIPALLLLYWLINAVISIVDRFAEKERLQTYEADRKARAQAVGNEAVARDILDRFGFVVSEALSSREIRQIVSSTEDSEDVAVRLLQPCFEVEGVRLGVHPIPGCDIPIVLPESYRQRHAYIVGKSGFGKTTLIRHQVLQDVAAGHGLAVIAPEQELISEEILPHLPEERWDDVIYINPADTERPVAINPLEVAPGEDLERKVDETFTVFRRIFTEDQNLGPRTENILRQGLYTLMQMPQATLLDFERLMDRTDDRFRKEAVDQIDDESARSFWLKVYPGYPKDAHLPLVNRLGRLLRPKVVRSMLCQPVGSLNIRQAMDEGKILLFNLSDGILGESNAQLLGQLVVAKLQVAAMSRADTAKTDRRRFYLYIDEFQTFCGVVGTSYEKILSRARKYGLGLILAHQQTGQIPHSLLREILGNVSTAISFQVSASDAKRLAPEMVGEKNGSPSRLESDELLALRIGEAWAKVGRNVLFVRTDEPPDGGDPAAAQEVIRRSRERWGVAVEEVGSVAAPAGSNGDSDTAGVPAATAETNGKADRPVSPVETNGKDAPASVPIEEVDPDEVF